jgi:uncharacterized protein (DUF58 family)
MRASVIPSNGAVWGLCGAALVAALALLLQAPPGAVAAGAGAALVLAGTWAAGDLWFSLRAWRATPLRVARDWPAALALGVPRRLELTLVNEGRRRWQVDLFDDIDARLQFDSLPRRLSLAPRAQARVAYRVIPRQRGTVRFGPTQLRVRTLGGCFELRRRVGHEKLLRVFPNFAAVARYAWLASDRRLTQIGIKTYVQRGAGTDFKQLADYRPGDPTRHIDWKASLRQSKPIVRQFEDSRDQRVLFLLDCGRRMRASEDLAVDGGHFDHALNALMLLSYVALKEGDEVGVMTFASPAGREAHCAARKGMATLNALMARLHDIEPGTAHSDYQRAAMELMRTQGKRALVIVLTNFRDEDVAELKPALALLRSRHLVLLASLRERVYRELAAQPLARHSQAVAVAGAHLFEQSRRDAFRRMVGDDPLAIDVEPGRLAVSLVNHYHAVKRARLL